LDNGQVDGLPRCGRAGEKAPHNHQSEARGSPHPTNLRPQIDNASDMYPLVARRNGGSGLSRK
jgi:hypothetical protein